MMDKACPVVTRPDGTVLAFRHPLAGLQFVKGGVEPGETPAEAAERELREEAGVALSARRTLGQSGAIVPGDIWHFWLMEPASLPDTWDHAAPDDGGHVFSFFWQDLAPPLPPDFADPFHRAADHIRGALA